MKTPGVSVMLIRSAAETRLLVELTAQDLRELDITYEALDYATIETRRVIWTVLDRAGKQLDRTLDPSRRMLIEAAPAPAGGCTLTFTFLNGRYSAGRQTQLRKQSRDAICEFGSAEALLGALAQLAAQEDPPQSSLYARDGRYRLLLSAPAGVGGACRRIREYCCAESTEPLLRAFTKEHWQLLATDAELARLLRP